jgi:hypothetical protein
MRLTGKRSPDHARRLRRRTLPLLVAVLVLDFAVGSLWFDERTPPEARFDAVPAAAYDLERVGRIQDDGESARFVYRDGLWRISEVSSELVNVDGTGSRRTVGGRPGGVRVAFLGGSAAFGMGQGDDRTIASELARSLNADGGVPVDVVNFGTPSWTLVDGVRDLRMRIDRGNEFDVVVTYSGANEMFMGFLGWSVPDSMLELTLKATGKPSDSIIEHWADRSALARLSGRTPRAARSPLRVVDSTSKFGSLMRSTLADFRNAAPEQLAVLRESVRFNYAEGDRMLSELSREYGFSVLHVVQPLLSDSNPGFTTTVRPFLIESVPDPLDLGGRAPSSSYFDNVHTNEPCSRDIAGLIAEEFRARGLGAPPR